MQEHSSANFTKQCNECKISLDRSKFHKNRASHDGLQRKCKECQSRAVSKNRDPIKSREYVWAYRTNPENHEKIVAYRKSAGWKDYIGKYNAEHRKDAKVRARSAVQCALRSGKLARPDCCESCRCKCKTVAHHASYDEEKWLTVEWLCSACHGVRHTRK